MQPTGISIVHGRSSPLPERIVKTDKVIYVPSMTAALQPFRPPLVALLDEICRAGSSKRLPKLRSQPRQRKCQDCHSKAWRLYIPLLTAALSPQWHYRDKVWLVVDHGLATTSK